MKKNHRQISFFLLSIALMIIFFLPLFNQSIFAKESLQLNGTEFGLEVIPEEGDIFNKVKILPGQVLDSKLLIKNNDFSAFELNLEVKKLDPQSEIEETDLYEQLIVTLHYKEEMLFKGSMGELIGRNAMTLGEFDSKEEQELDIKFYLPQLENKDKSDGLVLNAQWTFTARSETVIIEDEETPVSIIKVPKKNSIPVEIIFMAGAIILLGAVVLKKRSS